MEAQLVSEFVSRTGANQNDALSCLNTWGWDLKKALIDYNDTSTTDYFNGRADLKVSMVTTDSEPKSPQLQQQQQQQIKKPSLVKFDSIDVGEYKKLYRGISRATENENLVSRARSEIEMDFHINCYKQLENIDNIETEDFTFTLPDISIYSTDFRKFLEKDLIECSTLNSLETTQRLNWWADSGFCRKLWPLATSGDGNCLLHAASLAMWGFHDRKLTLRTALHKVLSKGEYRDALWRRWRFHQTRINKQAGFVYSEIEWAREWEEIVAMASPEPRQTEKGMSRRRSVAINDSIDDNATYESLEEIHIFALSHVLRRAIVVVADTVLRDMNGEAMAPIPFGGVYLPFEIPANECHRAPLLLIYDMAHFSALVSMEASADAAPALIPLIDFENVLLPIQFCIDPGQNFDWRSYDGNEGNWALSDREHIALLKEYLDIVYASPLGTPDEEIFDDLTDEEYERRIGEAEITLNDDCPNNGQHSKSKAAKQLQSVAKQFGSIGKSMSKKIKKNIGSITKIGGNGGGGSTKNGSTKKNGTLSTATSTQSFTRQRILCAQLKAKRHSYQEEMIKNYLECAQDRFIDAEKTKELQEYQRLDTLKSTQSQPYSIKTDAVIHSIEEQKTCCINAGCQSYGTAATSYMCAECFEKQKQRELDSNILDPPRYGTGNSRFYTQSDMQSHKMIKRLPSVRRLHELDQTLYLSNSTFYNDKIHTSDHQPLINNASFLHGYSPTPTELQTSAIRSSMPLSIDVTDNSADNDLYQQNGLPLGAASVFSPGKTIIHHIVRQTVNLPPSTNNTSSSSSSSSSATTPQHNINSAKEESIQLQQRPSSYNPVTIKNCDDKHESSSTSRIATPFVQLQAKQCRTLGCMFFGSANTNFYCSKCCQIATAAALASQQTSAASASATPTQKSQSKILTDV